MFKRKSKKFEGDAIACAKLYPFASGRVKWLDGVRKKLGMSLLSKTFTFSDGSLIRISCDNLCDSIYIKSGVIFDYIFGGLPGTLINLNAVNHAYGQGFGALLSAETNYKEVSYTPTDDPDENTRLETNFKKYEHLFLPYLPDGSFRNEYSFQPKLTWFNGNVDNIVSGSMHNNEHLYVYRYGVTLNDTDLGGEINSFNLAYLAANKVSHTGIKIGSDIDRQEGTISFELLDHIVIVRGKFSLQVEGVDWIYDLTSLLPQWIGTYHTIKLGTVTKSVRDAIGEVNQLQNDPAWKINLDGQHMSALIWKYVDYGDKTLDPEEDLYQYWVMIPYLTTVALNPYIDEDNGDLMLDLELVNHDEYISDSNPNGKPLWEEVDYYYGYSNSTALLMHTELVHEELIVGEGLAAIKYYINRLELFAEGYPESIAGANVYVGKFSKDAEGEWNEVSDQYVFNRVYFDLRYGTCCEFRRSPYDDSYPEPYDIRAYGYVGSAFNTPLDILETEAVKPFEFVNVYWPTTLEGETEDPNITATKFFAEVRGTIMPLPSSDIPYKKPDVIASQHKLQSVYKQTSDYDVVPYTCCKLDTINNEYKLSCLLYGMDGYFDLIDINGNPNIDAEGNVILNHENILNKIKTGELLPDGTPEFIILPETDDKLRYTFLMHGVFL